MNYKFITWAIGLALIFGASSCQKDKALNPTPSGADVKSNYQLASLVITCPSTCNDRTDTLQSGWVDSALVGIPSSWSTLTKYYNLETGEVSSASDYHFSLSGQFLSVLTSGATLGYFDSTNVKPADFASIDCSDTAYFSTSGVVSNAMGNHTASAQGWYLYNYMNPFVVNPSWVMGIHFATCGKRYAIKLNIFVTSQVVGAGPSRKRQYRSNVVVNIKCLGC